MRGELRAIKVQRSGTVKRGSRGELRYGCGEACACARVHSGHYAMYWPYVYYYTAVSKDGFASLLLESYEVQSSSLVPSAKN